jgi:hypothetical protein
MEFDETGRLNRGVVLTNTIGAEHSSSTSQFKGFPLEIAREALILGIEPNY